MYSAISPFVRLQNAPANVANAAVRQTNIENRTTFVRKATNSEKEYNNQSKKPKCCSHVISPVSSQYRIYLNIHKLALKAGSICPYTALSVGEYAPTALWKGL